MDLFQGQLCSVVTCNECGNVSRTFDPFTSLSLPLPTQNDITVIVTMLRRMPRLSSAALTLALTNEPDGYTAVTERILAAQMYVFTTMITSSDQLIASFSRSDYIFLLASLRCAPFCPLIFNEFLDSSIYIFYHDFY